MTSCNQPTLVTAYHGRTGPPATLHTIKEIPPAPLRAFARDAKLTAAPAVAVVELTVPLGWVGVRTFARRVLAVSKGSQSPANTLSTYETESRTPTWTVRHAVDDGTRRSTKFGHQYRQRPTARSRSLSDDSKWASSPSRCGILRRHPTRPKSSLSPLLMKVMLRACPCVMWDSG
jgi:hypothetical protein